MMRKEMGDGERDTKRVGYRGSRFEVKSRRVPTCDRALSRQLFDTRILGHCASDY